MTNILSQRSTVGSAIILLALLLLPTLTLAQRNYPPTIPDAEAEVYKRVGDVELRIYGIYPDGHESSDQRPAIVFFFGGGWRGGSPEQFLHQARYLASRGMVAFTADYRVSSRHGTKAIECVQDGKSAIRWVRAHAGRLGIDPMRIVASGGSAGGHVAACTGVISGRDERGEDYSISSAPNAMILFNPAVVLASVPGSQKAIPADRLEALGERMGVEPKTLSPYHNVLTGQPPTLVFHGKADSTVPYATAELFAKAMTQAGNRCDLAGYEGQAHGFFNFGRADNASFRSTMKRTDQFLRSLGYLHGESTIDAYFTAIDGQ